MSFTFIVGLAHHGYATVYNLYLREMEVSNVLIGNAQSFILWGAAILGFLLAIVADRWGRRKMLLISILGSITFGLLRVQVLSPTLLLLFSFLYGGFNACRMTTLITLLLHNTSQDTRAKWFGMNFGLNMATGVVGNFLGGWFGDLFGLQTALIIMIAIEIAALVPYRKIPDTVIREKAKLQFDPGQKFVLFYFLSSTMCIGFGAGLFIHFGNLIFRDLFGLSATLIGVVLAIAQLATAIGSILSPKMGRFVGPSRLLLWSHFLVVPLIFAMAFIREPLGFTATYSMRFVLMNMVNPIVPVLVFSHLPPNTVTSIQGLSNLVNNSMRALATFAFGFMVTSANGYTQLFIISGCFYLLNAILTFFFYRKVSGSKIEREVYAKSVKLRR